METRRALSGLETTQHMSLSAARAAGARLSVRLGMGTWGVTDCVTDCLPKLKTSCGVSVPVPLPVPDRYRHRSCNTLYYLTTEV